jgi:general secretion pathway protein M
MQQWFKRLTRQEQLMLLLCAAVVSFYLLYVVLLNPISMSVESLQQKNHVAEESLQNIRSLAQQYKLLQKFGTGKSSVSRQSLTRLIDSAVKKNELVMKRFQPSSSGDVQVRFENASFSNILAWLNDLESGNGVIIKDLSVSPGGASGIVNVSVRLRQGV